MTKDSFDWVDILIRRWQILVALVGFTIWLTTLQLQVLQAAQGQTDIKTEIKSFSDIKAEWPYLKNKVEGIDRKLDRLLQRQPLGIEH